MLSDKCMKCGKDLTKEPQFNPSATMCDKCYKELRR